MNYPKFTYRFYHILIEKLVNNGYVIISYRDYKNVAKPCILRHDVDYDVQKALEFAKFESGIGKNVSATYFFLLSSDFYNIFSPSTLVAINKIISLGNEIGLHFDETRYAINNNEKLFVEFVEEELYILGKAIGKTITTVSMHRPSKNTLEKDYKFNNAINSYSKEFFTEFKYISDSRMNWREDVISIIESKKSDKLHILTHPFWYSHKEQTTREKILEFINKASKQRYQVLSKNLRDLSEFVKEDEIE